MKFSRYFLSTRQRPDLAVIHLAWIEAIMHNPVRREMQEDGRVRLWGYVPEEEKYLRIILLEDGETVHNAFFDRTFRE